MPNLLDIIDLTVTLAGPPKGQAVVSNVSVSIPAKSMVALVGGSGSGKTTTALSILRLLPAGLEISSGKILFEDHNLLEMSNQQLLKIRGPKIAMIFQEPLQALNPVLTIGEQIDEIFMTHTNFSVSQRRQRILELLNLVELPDPKRVVLHYPHQLSAGMRQRVMIAEAIALEPKLVIADEPTSNLDVTLQARILQLFKILQSRLNLSFLLITHDLGLVKHMADEMAIMTGGKIVEKGFSSKIFENPSHQYTQRLLKAVLE